MSSLSEFERLPRHTSMFGAHSLLTVDRGTGRPVVLVHGSPTTSALWRATVERLVPTRRVVVPDLLGQGGSSAPDDGVAFAEQAAALRCVLDELIPDGPFDLVVHDWGGPAGLTACSDRLDRIGRLVLVNTTFRPSWQPPAGWEPFVEPGSGETLLVEQNAWCEGLPLAMAAAANDPELHEHYLGPSRRIGTRRTFLRLERLEGFAELLTPVAAALTARPPATRIVWGENDLYFGEEYRVLTELLPSAELVLIPGGGHFPQEDAPELTAAAIGEWVLGG